MVLKSKWRQSNATNAIPAAKVNRLRTHDLPDMPARLKMVVCEGNFALLVVEQEFGGEFMGS